MTYSVNILQTDMYTSVEQRVGLSKDTGITVFCKDDNPAYAALEES